MLYYTLLRIWPDLKIIGEEELEAKSYEFDLNSLNFDLIPPIYFQKGNKFLPISLSYPNMICAIYKNKFKKIDRNGNDLNNE